MKKQIKVNFVDFWPNFVIKESRFYQILQSRYDVVLTDNPDYVFFSVFGTKHLKYKCITIFYTGEDQIPDFNIADYAIGFAKLSFGDRYFRLPLFYLYDSDFSLMMKKEEFTTEDLHAKTGFCSFVYSNKKAASIRENFYYRLSKYKVISSGGRHLNNVGGPVLDKLLFQKKHKFSIAFENYQSEGYITEKIVQSFAAQTIPIYWGDPSVKEIFNERAFINVDDYKDYDSLIKEIIRIDTDNSVFLKMMEEAALLHPEVDSQEVVIGKLSSFLFSIFDQPINKAKRYNRGFWGEFYKAELIRKEKAYTHSLRYLLTKLLSFLRIK